MICFHTKVVGRFALYLHSGLGIKKRSTAFSVVRDQFKNICKTNGIKDGFQVMVSICSFPQNMQTEIDLTVGKYNHGAGAGWV